MDVGAPLLRPLSIGGMRLSYPVNEIQKKPKRNPILHRKVLLLLLGCVALGCIVQAGSALVVAAGDSSAQSKAQADYTCDSTADQVEIQRALNALGSAGGTVTLTEGTFQLDSNLNIPSNVVLEGQGPDATWLSWSSGRIMCEAQQNVVLRDFKTTGTGAIFLYNSDHVKVHNVTATVDNSFYGGAFFLYVGNDVMEDIEFVNCKAIDCGRHGWQSAGEGSPRVIRNIRYIDCEAINCGRYSQYSPHGQWTCGFQLAENADVEDCQVIRCYAEGNLEAGFIVEAAPKKTRFVLQDCVSKNNGQKPDDYYNGPEDSDSYGCLFGAGFFLHGDMTLINCTAADNRNYGYAVWYPSAYASLYNCTDTGSEIGYWLDYTSNVHLENCISVDAKKYGIRAADAGQITTNGLVIVNPKGDGSKSNVFGISGYPIRDSSFNIDTYGGGGTPVSCPNGQNIQFSGTVRSNAAQPVAVSGSVDVSRLTMQPYSGEQPSPVTPTPTTPTPSGKPDLVVTDISWNPASPATGSAVTFSATLKNQGTAPAPAGVITGVAFLVDDSLTVWSDSHTSAIPPGEWVTVTANGGPSGSAIWEATSGTHTVQAWVDDIDRIAEADETNNVMSKEIVVGATPAPSGKPDLVVTDISWNPASPATGSAVTFSATLKNQGTAPAPAGVITGVAFLVDDSLTVWSDSHTSAIPPGEWVTVTANGGPSGSAIWEATSGTHTVQAWVDDIDRIAEADETNNVMSKEIVVGATPAPVRGDLNGDGSVDWADVTVAAEMAQGKTTPNTAADLDGNGTVDWNDVALLADFFFGRTSSL